MGPVQRTRASLRITGDDLIPDEVTRVLGCNPSRAHKKGDVIRNEKLRSERVARFGMWSIQATPCSPGDIDAQVKDLLGKLSSDLAAWRDLTSRFHADLFCGLFLAELNQGLTISADTMAALSSRGIELDLDIYSHAKDDQPNKAPEPTTTAVTSPAAQEPRQL